VESTEKLEIFRVSSIFPQVVPGLDPGPVLKISPHPVLFAAPSPLDGHQDAAKQ
jgi:hypothetical protein